MCISRCNHLLWLHVNSYIDCRRCHNSWTKLYINSYIYWKNRLHICRSIRSLFFQRGGKTSSFINVRTRWKVLWLVGAIPLIVTFFLTLGASHSPKPLELGTICINSLLYFKIFFYAPLWSLRLFSNNWSNSGIWVDLGHMLKLFTRWMIGS